MPAATYILARNHKFEVSSDNTTWTTISGVMNFSLGRDLENDDVTSFDHKGYKSELITGTQITLAFEGKKLVDSNGTRDTGQALVDASMKKFGADRLRYYRVTAYATDAFSAEWGKFTIYGSAKPGETTGGNFDHVNWSVEVPSFGKPVLASGIYADLYE